MRGSRFAKGRSNRELALAGLDRLQVVHDRLDPGLRLRLVVARVGVLEGVAPDGHVGAAVAFQRLAPVDDPLDALGRRLAALPAGSREQQRVTFLSLWHHAAILGSLLALLAVEWIVRKVRDLA